MESASSPASAMRFVISNCSAPVITVLSTVISVYSAFFTASGNFCTASLFCVSSAPSSEAKISMVILWSSKEITCPFTSSSICIFSVSERFPAISVMTVCIFAAIFSDITVDISCNLSVSGEIPEVTASVISDNLSGPTRVQTVPAAAQTRAITRITRYFLQYPSNFFHVPTRSFGFSCFLFLITQVPPLKAVTMRSSGKHHNPALSLRVFPCLQSFHPLKR